MRKQFFGKTHEEIPVDLYTLTNLQGLEVKITNYGATVVSLKMPRSDGKLEDIALGFDQLDGYFNCPYFGCIVGRYANRIAKGIFSLNGIKYCLNKNNGDNHLHGGIKGFDKVIWKAEPIEGDDDVALQLTYLSLDGEEGYPGNLSVKVIYSLTDQNELKINYFASTDKITIINLTNHLYFNLAGINSDILGHELMICADRFTPVNKNLIPTGEFRDVKETPMDFLQSTSVGARIKLKDQQLIFANGGYDHNWVFAKPEGMLSLAAKVKEPISGRGMEVFTTEPGIQFYSGNFLDGSIRGKGDAVYHKHYGFCLETQRFPDSPNQPHFPSVVLKPGEEYRQTTVYKFVK